MIEYGTMPWYAAIGAKAELKTYRTEIRKIETILRTPSIAGHLSSSTLDELQNLAITIMEHESNAKNFLDGQGNEAIAVK